MLLPFIQYHEIDGNSIKILDLSMLLNDTANGRKKKNCKFWLCFCKSVQGDFVREISSLTTAMQILSIKERAVSNAKFETARFRGKADLGKKRRSWGREAYLYTSRPQNGGKKSPIKIKIRKDFYLIVISFSF